MPKGIGSGNSRVELVHFQTSSAAESNKSAPDQFTIYLRQNKLKIGLLFA